jgi:hypothetical protein
MGVASLGDVDITLDPMKHHHPCLAAALLLISAAAPAQTMEKWGYPDPDVFAKAVHSLCEEQNLSVLLASRYRDQGRSKTDVLALIPENPPSLQLRAIDAYRENVEDVYAFPQFGTYAMTVFRAEVCRKEVMSARTLGRFATVHEKVAACESQHGKVKSNELYGCVRKVVLSM